MLPNYIEARIVDNYCYETQQYIGLNGTAFTYKKNRVLIGKEAVESAIRKVVPTSSCTRIFNFSDYCLFAGHRGGHPIYDPLNQDFYWSHTVSVVYTLVNKVNGWVRMGTRLNHQRTLKLWSHAGSLEFVAIENLGLLKMAKAGSQFVAVMTDRHTKLAWAVLKAKITSAEVTNIFSTTRQSITEFDSRCFLTITNSVSANCSYSYAPCWDLQS